MFKKIIDFFQNIITTIKVKIIERDLKKHPEIEETVKDWIKEYYNKY